MKHSEFVYIFFFSFFYFRYFFYLHVDIPVLIHHNLETKLPLLVLRHKVVTSGRI